MTRTTRWAAATFVAIVPLTGLTYAYPEWPMDAGLDLWNAPSLQSEFERNHQQSELLDADVRATLDRIGRKNEIAIDLIEGRTSLARATTEFRALNAANPRFITVMRSRYPDASEQELHARNVVLAVMGVLEGHPERSQFVAQLHRDMERLTTVTR